MTTYKTSSTYQSCLYCEKPFRVQPYQLALGTKRYCSRQCTNADRPNRATPLEIRFWKYVQKTDSCWLWTASLDANGYGRIQTINRIPVLAHRVSWEIHNGPIPEGVLVLHNCPDGDNPTCVNPAHLFLGDQTDNMQDCSKKGRTTRGERSGHNKLTELTVAEIRTRYAAGNISQAELAKEYGIVQATITEIIRGVIWSHSFVPQDNPPPRRRAHGERTGGSKLTAAAVLDIRARSTTGTATVAELAKEHSVSGTNIKNIISGKTWKHLL